MSDAGSSTIGASRGAPSKAFLSLLDTSDSTIVGLDKSGIRTAEDLEGEKLALSPGEA